jgi:flagellar M-ring protein FliF
MDEKWKGYLTKGTQTVKGVVSKVSKKVWIACAAVLVVVALVVTIVINNRPYSVLFCDLSTDEASTIVNLLEEMGNTNYRLEDGDTILVPTSQVEQLKISLLQQGYPKTGFAYDSYWDNVSSLSTESERNRAALEDLQERLAATIECMDGVKYAVVTLNEGEDNSYVLDSGNVVEASASVLVVMKDGGSLSSQMAETIRALVSHAMKGLEVDGVVVVDGLGNTYSGTASDGLADDESSALKLQLEEENSNRIRTSVLQALTPLFGEDNVAVGVSCTVDVGYSEAQTHNVSLPEGTDGQQIVDNRDYEYAINDDDALAGGVVGTSSNADLPSYVEQDPEVDEDTTRLEGSGSIQYDNPYEDVYSRRTAGEVTDCTIAVTINSTTAGEVNVSEIREHVARAAGISLLTENGESDADYLASKISVVAMPFYEPTTVSDLLNPGGFTLPVPQWVVYAAAAGLLLFLVLLIVILTILKKRRKKKLEAGEAVPTVDELMAMAAETAAEPAGADVMSMQSERSMELRKEIRKFVEENPQLAAQMLKLWLRGGEENG